MDLGSAIRVLLRRWLVVLIGVGLSLGAGLYLYRSAPPSYQATANMLLLLPANARGPQNIGSPYLYLPNGLNVMARLVSGAPLQREFRQEMQQLGLASTFQVGVDPTTPILTISAQGTDPDDVIRTRDHLVEALQDELLVMQEEEEVPPYQTAHARVYANEELPTQLGGDGTRAALAAVAAGGLLTLVAAFGIDALMRGLAARRERRRAPAHAEDDTAAPEEAADDEPSP